MSKMLVVHDENHSLHPQMSIKLDIVVDVTITMLLSIT